MSNLYCEDNRGCYWFMQKNTSFLCLECDIAGNAGKSLINNTFNGIIVLFMQK